MDRYRRVKGYEFEFVDQGPDDRFYQCRGDVYYDDEHDEKHQHDVDKRRRVHFHHRAAIVLAA